MNKPIFIAGCTKSGTTLMRNLFDGHSSLFSIPFESHFFENSGYWISYFFRRRRPEKLEFDGIKQNLFQWIIKMNKTSDNITDNFIAGKINENLFKEYIFSHNVKNLKELSDLYTKSIFYSLFKQEYSDSLRFVEKSVENSEMALDWLRLYPEAKFVHILRNPYSNIVAIRKYMSQNKFPFLKKAIFAMYNSYYHLYKNLRLINHNQYKVVRYEDVISQPEETMRDVSHFLDIDYSEILTIPTILGEPWGGNSTSGVKFNGVSKMNLEKWKTEITNYEIFLVNEFFGHVLSDFGFSKNETKSSVYKISPKESLKIYLANRALPFFLPRFKN